MGILELIEQFEDDFYPISDEKKSLLIKQLFLPLLSAYQIWPAGRLAEVRCHGN